MKYISIPYYFDNTNTHFLEVKWFRIAPDRKIFSWNDKLFTIQLIFTKNKVQVSIHNSYYHYIEHYTTTTISKAIETIEESLYYIVNHVILKDTYELYTEHNLSLDTIYTLAPYGPPDDDLLPF